MDCRRAAPGFGDSSAGEIFVDASSLLIGALLAFWIVKAIAGFRWGVAAGAGSLMTYSLGTTWYFVGRGLSETVGAGFGFAAAFFLLRGRLGRPRSIAAAGVLAGADVLYASQLPGDGWRPGGAAAADARDLPRATMSRRRNACGCAGAELLGIIARERGVVHDAHLVVHRPLQRAVWHQPEEQRYRPSTDTIADPDVWQPDSPQPRLVDPHERAAAFRCARDVGHRRNAMVVLAAIQVPPFRRLPRPC